MFSVLNNLFALKCPRVGRSVRYYADKNFENGAELGLHSAYNLIVQSVVGNSINRQTYASVTSSTH